MASGGGFWRDGVGCGMVCTVGRVYFRSSFEPDFRKGSRSKVFVQGDADV